MHMHMHTHMHPCARTQNGNALEAAAAGYSQEEASDAPTNGTATIITGASQDPYVLSELTKPWEKGEEDDIDGGALSWCLRCHQCVCVCVC